MTVRKFEIPSLDGIRALAFFFVFFSHTPLLKGIIPGGFGVTTFFFLSGYLITTLLRHENEKSGGVSVLKFYLRRALRILPVLFAALLISGVTAVFLGSFKSESPLPALSAHLFFYTNYYSIYVSDRMFPGMQVLWSLAVEEHFYLIFPWMYLILSKCFSNRQHQSIVLILFWILISAWRCLLVFKFNAHAPDVQRIQLATDTRLDSILIGCILALWNNPILDPQTWSDHAWKKITVASIIALSTTFFLPGVDLRESIRYSFQNLALLPLFYAAVRFPDWIIFSWLQNQWIRFVGQLSYGLYLVHGLLLHVVSIFITQPFVAMTLGLASSVMVAFALYQLIELPILRFRKSKNI